ncbi:MAG: aminotransferase class V-fold PLP-dependent enzyme [Bacteroidetes bacterium]|nr:aminotransferase class V-fold PLP-dependent enzyme [Bacteroidota bacterium]
MSHPIYLDYAATTPVDERVLEAMLPYWKTHFGNASSKQHAYGWVAAEGVSKARAEVAALIGAEDNEIIFTSGATEAINLALRGVATVYGKTKNHIISCVTEHRAVLDTLEVLGNSGYEITLLPVDTQGNIDLKELEESIRPETMLMAFMYGNNETGVVHPVREIGKIARAHGVLFFCDATQAIGKVDIEVNEDKIDLLAMSAHKMYGPKGVGALYVRRKQPRVQLMAQLTGGGQERGLRSGTLNVGGIVGMGAAARICKEAMTSERLHLQSLRSHFEASLLKSGKVMIQGKDTLRLPHISNITMSDYQEGNLLTCVCTSLAVSSGSTCSYEEESHVLKAMGLSAAHIRNTLRISIGRMTTREEVTEAVSRMMGL